MKKLIVIICVMLAAGGLFSLHADNNNGGMQRVDLLTQDARIMGMGGAFTAVADDYNALFYNPAGLAFLNRSDFVLGTTVYSSFDNATLDKFIDDVEVDPLDLIQQLHVIPRASFADRNWGVAAISRVRIEKPEEVDESMHVPFYNDLGLTGAFAMGFGPLSVGANVRLYKSISDEVVFDDSEEPEVGEILKKVYNFEKIGDADNHMEVGLGAMFTIGSISAGAYVDKFLSMLDGYEEHIFEDVLNTANVGVSFTPTNNKLNPRPFSLVNLIVAADINNIGDEDARSINVGTEFGLHLSNAVKFDFRAGYRQGIPGKLGEMTMDIENGEAFFGLGTKLLILDLNAAVALPAQWIQDSLDADDAKDFADYNRSPRLSVSGGIRL